ncbi:MAG: Nitroreductase family [Nevskia sp.]|nr:Nitroreductase family [Nevskia sp.]
MSPITVSEAVRSRRSVRAFLDTPVPETLLREALELAALAPSGGNVQPWRIYVLAGERLAQLKQAVRQSSPAPPEYPIYPEKLGEPYRSSRYKVGEEMYALLGIPREDKMARMKWLMRNFEFFGAPIGLFCYVGREMGSAQWSDLGMYLQTLMLLLRERGLDSCPQEAWATQHRTVGAFLQSPPEWMLFCGMGIGHADPAAPVNGLRSERAPLEQFAVLQGF